MKTRTSSNLGLRRLLPVSALALLLAAGTATAQTASGERRLAARGYVKAEAVEVVPDMVITSWDFLDNQSVLVHRDAARHYLVTLDSPCPALSTAATISFNAAIAGLGSSSALSVGSGANAMQCGLGPIYRVERSATFNLSPPETRAQTIAR